MSTTAQTNEDFVQMCEVFLRKYCHEDILELAEQYPSEQKSLFIDWSNAYQFDPGFGDDLLESPEKVTSHIKDALERYDLPVDIDLSEANIRLYNLPEDRTYDIGGYSPDFLGEQIGVRGQVTQLSEAKPRCEEAVFVCQRCGTKNTIPQDGTTFQEPGECQGCERQGPYKPLVEKSEFIEHQVARLQLPPEKTRGGQSHLDVHLNDDLASDSIEGNERVRIDGQLTIDSENVNDNGTFDYYLDGSSVEVTEGGYDDTNIEEHREQIREIERSNDPLERLVGSFAPHLKLTDELEKIVKGIILQLHGAPQKDPQNGPTYRGDFHMLVLGDPGTAKSELLKVAEELAPRAKHSSGKNLSKAGATAAAVRDDFGPSEYTLKAGLLVLANRGIACLDEIDKVEPEVLSSMHEALESQRVSVVKAGIDADLPARTTLLAAGNPKYGRFDIHEPIGEQIELPPSMMSRFDLMFMVSDQPDETRDREIAEHMYDSWTGAADMDYGSGEMSDVVPEREISEDVFRAYIADARENITPTIEDPAVGERIIEEYINLRSKGTDENSPVPVTARKLEAFFRLSEAAARARHSETVEKEDVDLAVDLILKSLEDVGVDPETGELDTDIVETGTSKTERNRKQQLKAVVADVEEEHQDMGAPYDAVFELASELGVPEGKIDHTIEDLKEKGEIYQHDGGYLRST